MPCGEELCGVFPTVLSIIVGAGVCVAHVWTRTSTFRGESAVCDYFGSMEGISANSRFIARGESPELRRM
jgi:hypothetical protein